MRIALITAAAALALATGAHAQGPSQQSLQTAPNTSSQQTLVGVTTATTATAAAGGGSSTSNATGGQSTSNAGGAVVSQNYERAPVASAFASPLSFSQGTCYVSASAGGQGITFGLSASLPFEDKACTVRATAQALNALGAQAAALEYLKANVRGVREAIEAARTH